MDGRTSHDNKTLIDFWNKAFAMSDEEKAEMLKAGADDLKELAPSRKLYEAARSLGGCKKVLDYGCGSAWAAIIAAKSGCPDVTAADPAPAAVEAALLYAEAFGVGDRVRGFCISADWLLTVPEGSYDGFICSNVLDVVPPETASFIIKQSARVVTADASVVIGLNYYLSPEAAKARGMELEDGRSLYVDGVLRLVSRKDEEWTELFAPCYHVERLEHFAWPVEKTETRRLFYLRRRK